MRLIVITLLSVLGYSLADILQVKCGDELCERPSNLAVTTLRYVPDKPYKLQINSLNSEVEIFGATNDLYYARYGRNYGFLPKNHLREKARGNFQHSVEINFGTIKINAELKEKNFLHEILKSSQQPIATQNVINETASSNDVKENDKQQNSQQEEKVESATIQEERPKDYIPIGTEPKIPVQQPEIVKTESADESKKIVEGDSKKLDDVNAQEPQKTNEIRSDEKPSETEEELDDEEDDDEEEDEEDDEEEIFDSQEKNETEKIENPEIAKIQPAELKLDEKVNQPEVAEKLPEETEKVPEVTEKIDERPIQDEKTQVPEVTKKIDERPIQEIKEPEKIPENQNILEEIKTDVVDEGKPKEEIVTKINEFENKTEKVQNEFVEPPSEHQKIEEIPKEIVPEVIQEVTTEIPKDPAPVTEEIIESQPIPTVITTEPPIQAKFEPEIPTTIIIETTTTQSYEPITEKPDIQPEISTEVPPPTQEKREVKVDQDLLLKRFDEKLGHKHAEGIGSAEQLHKNHQHGHSHSHDHSHETINSPHHHEHESGKNEFVNEEVVQNVDLDKKPGFFNGLVKKIFGDDHESHTHSHDAKEHVHSSKPPSDLVDEGFCEKIDSENCPKSLKSETKRDSYYETVTGNLKSTDEYLKMMLSEAVEMLDVIITMGLVALTVLIFIFGHYCISKASKEGDLIRKMNALERELMASTKENGSLKAEVEISKQQLKSIQDNSFGSNDMVIALKQDLELNEREKDELLEKISSLEKELEAAAEDGLELNRMVSELLNNQSGSDSIISSVEDLQRQLNEQQETIITMNETLAAKSRENTELQIQLSEINGKFSGEFEKFQQQFDALTLERSNLQIELENLKRESDMQVNQIIEERNSEVTRLNSELTLYAGKYDENKKLLNAAESKVQALEECIETIRKNKGGDFKNLLDVADLKADLLAVTKEKSTIQEQLQNDRDSRKLLEDRVKTISEEMSNLKREFSVAEKEKLEAQTRLDVLSNYFKEKETQLQQELSVKEARWMKQQGETTSTVEKVQALNEEIQTLKSQNDELKAELEAQIAGYKAKLSSVEGQSHSAWLTAKQAERKLEESRMEAAALRRRLTSIAENPTGANADLLNGLPGATNDSMNSIPSPMRVESPNNISLPPPPLMMPPFLPGAPPFLPPPFMPGEMPPMGLPPLGRLMSPPPKRFTPTMRDDRDRYSPRRYSPDSRYDDYTPFETETDISPPRTPPPRRGYSSPTERNKKSKGHNSEQPSRRK